MFSTYISYSNKEISLRNTIAAKMTDNKSEYDNMWKKISQVATVSQKERDSLMQIFVGHATARTTQGDGSLMKWIQESIPNVDSKTFTNLQNTITGSRDAWTMRQKELIDLKREHDNIRTMFPGSLFLASRKPIEIQIVTSTRTDTSFETGKDDSVEVFK
jgi:hypothetical protein